MYNISYILTERQHQYMALHLNIQSLSAKFGELKLLLSPGGGGGGMYRILACKLRGDPEVDSIHIVVIGKQR